MSNVSSMMLSKLPRQACLAITGTVKSTPPAAKEVLLELPALHVMTVVEAQAGIYRPKSTNFGHAKKSWDM